MRRADHARRGPLARMGRAARLPLLAALVAAAGAIAGCSDDSTAGSGGGGPGGSAAAGAQQPPPAAVFGPAYSRLLVEVDYAEGAAPEVGDALGYGDAFGIFERNARALFGDSKELVVPKTLGEMQELTGITGETFTAADIDELARLHRSTPNTATQASYYVIWLEGVYEDDTGARGNVLGLSLGTTGIIAMFKPVIRFASQGVLPGTRTMLEQAVLVHEFGHAVGLVDNGLAMSAPHRDEEHGRHCDNDACVMFYALAGGDDPVGFVTSLAMGGDILYGPECLADGRAALER